MATSISELNQRFALPGLLAFGEGPGGLTVARVTSPQGEAMISLSGGHVMTWNPAGEKPVLWLSGYATFAPSKSIRGGVPVCWPWFGPHASEAGFPGHGFARTVPWSVVASEASPDGRVKLTLELEQSEATRALWPHAGSVQSVISVDRELSLSLVTRNLGTETFVLGEALHTYFAVGDVRQAPIHGLSGCTFLDKVDGGIRKTQDGAIVIGSEVDRVYVDTEADCTIDDASMGRRIRIRKSGSRSTVVWNPWSAKAEKMGDFGPDGHLGMVCVETGNALENAVSVAPGGEHVMNCVYSIEALS
ncbi:MAG: D-hexose-6-phosphate mutarotase [Rhodocyclaceae bacterium]|nr:D-hexose-6-phosphate mutarotase [Rhodocyclaceae bacterium]